MTESAFARSVVSQYPFDKLRVIDFGHRTSTGARLGLCDGNPVFLMRFGNGSKVQAQMIVIPDSETINGVNTP
jgi:hypothetical protein